MKKISIIGGTIVGNRGAEAMLVTTVEIIRKKYPDAQFYIYSYNCLEDKKVIVGEHITIHSATPLSLVLCLFPLSLMLAVLKFFLPQTLINLFPGLVSDLNNSDLLVDIAGVSFMDGREIFLPFNMLTILPAILMGTPVVKFSQGLGPFKNYLNRLSAKFILSSCKQIFARGNITLGHLNELFPTGKNYQEASDVSFSYPGGAFLSKENIHYVNEVRSRLTNFKNEKMQIVGLCPSSVVFLKLKKADVDYISIWTEAIKMLLLDEKTSVLIFPNASFQGKMESLRNNDLPLIKQIMTKLSNEGVSTERIIGIDKDINTCGIKSLIELCDITVVSRFHAMIASLALSKPVMVLGWSHKYLEVMREFKMEEWVFDYKVEKLDFSSKIVELLATKDECSIQISELLPPVVDQSYKQFAYIFNEILK